MIGSEPNDKRRLHDECNRIKVTASDYGVRAPKKFFTNKVFTKSNIYSIINIIQ